MKNTLHGSHPVRIATEIAHKVARDLCDVGNLLVYFEIVKRTIRQKPDEEWCQLFYFDPPGLLPYRIAVFLEECEGEKCEGRVEVVNVPDGKPFMELDVVVTALPDMEVQIAYGEPMCIVPDTK